MLVRPTRAASHTRTAGAELTGRTGALAHTGTPGLALSTDTDLPLRTCALSGSRAAWNADVLAITDLTSRAAALAGATRAAHPDFTLAVDADLAGRARTLGAVSSCAPCHADGVGVADLALLAVALGVVRRAAANAWARPGRGVTGRCAFRAAHTATHNARGWAGDGGALLVRVTGLVLCAAHRATEDPAHRAWGLTRARLRVTGLAVRAAHVPALGTRRRAALATLTVGADLVGQTAVVAADEVRRRTGVLADAVETGLV